ncbi:MAG: arsenite methyltransferase [Armatimonadota bacterium]
MMDEERKSAQAEVNSAKTSSCCSGTSSCCGSGEPGSATIKLAVKQRYASAAVAASGKQKASCCDGGSLKDAITSNIYTELEAEGIPDEALLASLGCANPHALAALLPGEVVLDLGSGGGIDVLLSAKRVGPTGKAYGLDMTDEMLVLARSNQAKAGATNVEFLMGEIENIPLPDSSIDVIISNCVINLSPDKAQVLREAYRVLKPGGRFAVADVVLENPLTDIAKRNLSMWCSCISGAIVKADYLDILNAAGFADAKVTVARRYTAENADGLVPSEVIAQLSDEELTKLMSSFISAFVTAKKPISTK